MGIRAFGDTAERVFVNAARGMFELITDCARVRARQESGVRVKARSREELLVEWLRELLYLHAARGMVFSSFRVTFLVSGLRGIARGEKIDRRRHALKAEIKAVTYHGLKLVRTGTGWSGEIIFDT